MVRNRAVLACRLLDINGKETYSGNNSLFEEIC